jgi:hypothetical protein
MPAKAGIQALWIPAFAGMTDTMKDRVKERDIIKE